MTLLLGALAIGAVYALVAIGYNVVFISSGTFNFAQAQLMMVGAFMAYVGLVTYELPVVVVLVGAAAVVGGLALLEERIAVRPVADHHTQLVTTLGFATVLNGATQLIWGGAPLTVPFFASNEVVDLLGGRVYPVELALIAAAVIMVVALTVASKRLMLGMALVALSEDREAAMLRGINVRRLIAGAFAFSGMMAGAVGLLVGPKTYAVATLGASLAVLGFVALAIGGMGSMPGSLIGGLVVGLVVTYSARYLGSEYANLSVFAALIAILVIRPSGLFGRATERVV